MITNGDDGILVPCENVDALALALDAMLGDQTQREAMGAKAALSARKYLPERILAEWDGVLLSAVDRQGQKV